jgi:hypothetical protein
MRAQLVLGESLACDARFVRRLRKIRGRVLAWQGWVWEGVRRFEVRAGAAATSEGGRLRQVSSLKSL